MFFSGTNLFASSAMSFWSMLFALFLYVYFSLPLLPHLFLFLPWCNLMAIYQSLFLCFQSAVLYTTIDGQRRIRVSTLALPCTTLLNNMFRSADLDTQFACILKQGRVYYVLIHCHILKYNIYFTVQPPHPPSQWLGGIFFFSSQSIPKF